MTGYDEQRRDVKAVFWLYNALMIWAWLPVTVLIFAAESLMKVTLAQQDVLAAGRLWAQNAYVRWRPTTAADKVLIDARRGVYRPMTRLVGVFGGLALLLLFAGIFGPGRPVSLVRKAWVGAVVAAWIFVVVLTLVVLNVLYKIDDLRTHREAAR